MLIPLCHYSRNPLLLFSLRLPSFSLSFLPRLTLSCLRARSFLCQYAFQRASPHPAAASKPPQAASLFLPLSFSLSPSRVYIPPLVFTPPLFLSPCSLY